MSFFKKQKCSFQNPIVTMGTFDGVHLGHQKLLKKLKKEAEQKGKQSVVITYFHHPLEIIHKKVFPYLLTERKYKEKLIKNLGIDCVLYLDFTPEMAAMPAEEFLKKILLKELETKKIIVGYDTHFGSDRMGNFELLNKYTSEYDFEADMIEPLKIDNKIVSSSMIRDYIREGDVKNAAVFLGRDYRVSGEVVHGERIGNKIGFPTINMQPHDENKLIPAIGVYVCIVKIDGKRFKGVTNVGYSPTLKTSSIKEIETYLLDFEGDLYGKTVELIFKDRIRDEKFFQEKSELIKEIEKDVKKTRQYFQM